MDRYERQRIVGVDGRAVDARLAALRVLLVGVGGIGAPLALGLTRAGVGRLVLVDPDIVSETDLARQVLYFPEDVRAARSKVEAAARELGRIESRTRIETMPIALTPWNAESLIREVDLVLDASDHLPVRFWIDESCRTLERAWIHTAAIGDTYVVIPFMTGGSPCFRCWVPDSPPTDAIGTCESVGVIPIATALAAQHALSALWGWLRGIEDAPPRTRKILHGRVGDSSPRTSRLLADPACPGCGQGTRPPVAGALRLLCGRKRIEGWVPLAPAEVREKLVKSSSGGWTIEEGVAEEIRATRGEESLVIYPDGRLVYGPAEDLERARRRLEDHLGSNFFGETNAEG